MLRERNLSWKIRIGTNVLQICTKRNQQLTFFDPTFKKFKCCLILQLILTFVEESGICSSLLMLLLLCLWKNCSENWFISELPCSQQALPKPDLLFLFCGYGTIVVYCDKSQAAEPEQWCSSSPHSDPSLRSGRGWRKMCTNAVARAKPAEEHKWIKQNCSISNEGSTPQWWLKKKKNKERWELQQGWRWGTKREQSHTPAFLSGVGRSHHHTALSDCNECTKGHHTEQN